ncbi:MULTISPECIES: hypothetical protein [unclassified Lentimicrobium]|uniref:hypothetical protein n=1 Tax=unclassified Lentimicrobium TaxID=2677434 RepID=UPI001554B560|nr:MULTISPECIES: hypothetical protein [unclassified Lentimicrobium]NPD44468.1 hypothetical protein [Lentimicrobium sp. S6]NPD84232.1 hypothetical protein [Lentimicrobium sp. L6]
MLQLDLSILQFSSEKKITYPLWKRLWRIYKFLKRAKRKRKQEEKNQKNKKKEERNKEKRFRRRKRWRKIKVVARSFVKRGKISQRAKAAIAEQKKLDDWRRRKKNRLYKVYFKGFFKRKAKHPRQIELIARKKKEKAFQKYRKRRLYKFVLKKNRTIIVNFLKGKGLPPRKKKGPSLWLQISKKDQLTISTQSLMMFLMSYFFIELFSNLSMATTSLLFDYKTVVYYYNIEFLVDYDAWYADSIKTIFATGPIVSFIIAVLSLIIYSIVYLETGVLKTLLLWAILHGANQLIGGILIGNLLGKGLGYVIMYMYYSDTGKLIMSLLIIMSSVIVGTVSTKYWIMSANSYYNYSKPYNRPLFIISQVFIPYVVGTFLIWLISQPEVMRYDTLINISMIFMILPILILNKYYQEYYFEEGEIKIKLSYRIVIFALVFIAAYRILLDQGLRIG